MKDITIKASRIKKELIILGACFMAAFGLNIYSIVKFETDWSELIGQLHVVFGVAIIIYLLVGLFRLVYFGFSNLMHKK